MQASPRERRSGRFSRMSRASAQVSSWSLLLKVQANLYREAFRGVPIIFFQNRHDAALFEKMDLVRPEQVRLTPGSGVDCRAFASALPKDRPDGALRLQFVGCSLATRVFAS